MGNSGGKSNKIITKLDKRDIEALSKQTGLKQNEINDIFNKFMRGNPDGMLDKKQFLKLYDELRGEPIERLDEISDYVFNCFDSDHDGIEKFYTNLKI